MRLCPSGKGGDLLYSFKGKAFLDKMYESIVAFLYVCTNQRHLIPFRL